MTIEVGKFYRTKLGKQVRIYAIEPNEIHGAIKIKDSWDARVWVKWIAEDSLSEWIEPVVFDISCLPRWANWVAIDRSGMAFYYTGRPVLNSDLGVFEAYTHNDNCGTIPQDLCPKNVTKDWTKCRWRVDRENNQLIQE